MGYKKVPLQRFDGVLERPESPGEWANNDREMTVYNSTNEKLYSVIATTTGIAQIAVKLF